MIDRVEAGHVREERLGGADVRGRLLAADVLLAGLQRHAVRPVAVNVHRHADDPARRLAHVRVERREERRVRAAVSQRDAEPLRAAQRRRRRRFRPAARAASRLRRSVPTATSTPALFARAMTSPQIEDTAPFRPASAAVRRTRARREHGGAWDRRSRDRCRAARRARAGPRSSAESRNRRRRTACARARSAPLAWTRWQHRHRLGGGGGLVQQRAVGDLHPRQVARPSSGS